MSDSRTKNEKDKGESLQKNISRSRTCRLQFSRLDLIFLLSCIIALLFIASPTIIRIEWIYECVSDYLSVIPSTEYKTTYIDALAAMIGAFLAIIAALWTQQHFNLQEDRNLKSDNARYIYYSLRLTINMSCDCVNRVCNTNRTDFEDFLRPLDPLNFVSIYSPKQFEAIPNLVKNGNNDSPLDCLRREISSFNIEINSDWLRMLSLLPATLLEDDISYLVEIYEKLTCLSHAIRRYEFSKNAGNLSNTDIPNSELVAIYEILYYLCNLNLKEDYKNLEKKMRASFDRNDESYIYH